MTKLNLWRYSKYFNRKKMQEFLAKLDKADDVVTDLDEEDE